MTLMSPLVTDVHHHRGLRRHGGGAPLMGGVGYAGRWVRAVARHLHGCMAVGRAAGLQGGVCFTIVITWPIS